MSSELFKGGEGVALHSASQEKKPEVLTLSWDFPGGSDGKASAYNEGHPGSIPGSGRFPGEGNGNPLLPGKSHGLRILVGPSSWGCIESDTTERLHFHFHP